jgi:hypothetical protein
LSATGDGGYPLPAGSAAVGPRACEAGTTSPNRDPLAPRPSGRSGRPPLAAVAAAALALGAASPLGATTLSTIESAIAETEEQIAALEAKRACLGDCRDYGSTVVMLPDRGDPSGGRVTRRQLAEIRAALERAYPRERDRQRREAAYER